MIQQPRFVRQFGRVGAEAKRAIEGYVSEVKERTFPAVGKETYAMKKAEWEGFLARNHSRQGVERVARVKEGDEDLGDEEETEDGA